MTDSTAWWRAWAALPTEQERTQRLDARCLASRGQVRDVLIEEGREDLLAEYDQQMKLLDNGVTAARNAWHSISPAQRRVLELLEPGRTLWRCRHNDNLYEAAGEPHAVSRAALTPTVRNLVKRGLLECADGWRKVTLTERGRFVLAHGRPKEPQP